jgi:hypothetical protein
LAHIFIVSGQVTKNNRMKSDQGLLVLISGILTQQKKRPESKADKAA